MSRTHKILFLLLYGIFLFLTLNRHSRNEYFMYRSEIWSDKAGYFIYQPALLHYGLKQSNYPQDIVNRTGQGFSFDSITGLVRTKYTCGVAIMQFPFILIAEIIGDHDDAFPKGFTKAHHTMINIAAVSWLILGMIFLFQFLAFYVNGNTAFFTVFVVVLGTNLFYYGIFETGMSHVYSFAIASYSIWAWKVFFHFSKPKSLLIFSIGFASGLLVLIRPTNALLVAAIFSLALFTTPGATLRVFYNLKTLALLAIAAFLPFIPQLVFWQLTTGHLLLYSYGNEGFKWLRPMLINILFAPHNGFLLYTPMALLMLFSCVYLALKGRMEGSIPLAVLLVTLYVFSCWWDYVFGCAFGYRSMIEYFPIFSLPFAIVLSKLSQHKILLKILGYTLIFLGIAINLKLSYTWPSCYVAHHSGDWNWDFFFGLLSNTPL